MSFLSRKNFRSLKLVLNNNSPGKKKRDTNVENSPTFSSIRLYALEAYNSDALNSGLLPAVL